MPSPFPGMDPYLEDRMIFPDFHDGMITYLREAIQPALPAPYYAALGRRAWVEVTERYIGPDVNIISNQPGHQASAASVTTADLAVPFVVRVPHDEQVETLVEIYIGRGTERRLVTAIEVLSPGNKTPGEKGRDLYLRKQAELLDSKTHLVEIDLLRGGQHTTGVPEDRMRMSVPDSPWHICTHCFDHFEDFLVYPLQLRNSLPTIRIPLLPEDSDVAVCLQTVMQRTYDAGPYHREIEYTDPVPGPPMSERDLQWVRLQLTNMNSVD